jgi:oligopeptidase B
MNHLRKSIRGSALFALLVGAVVWLAGGCSKVPPSPPVAERIEYTDTVNGNVRVDYYHWLRNRGDSAVIAYLNAENAYTEAVMKHTEKMQEEIYQELKSRIKETDLSVPVKEDSFYYYSRDEEGKQYKIYCRKKGSLDAEEEILLDVNKLAKGYDFFDVGVRVVSPDHRILAYSVDTTGRERFTLYFKNLETGELLPDVVSDISYSVAWGNDNKSVFYTIRDEAQRPYKLFRHTLGDNSENDVLVYHEPDDAFWLSIKKSKSEKYLLMEIGSETTTEYRFLDADNPMGTFTVVNPRQPEMEYYVENHGDQFIILTNDNAKNFKMMTTPVSRPGKKNWKEIIPTSDNIKLDDFDVFQDYLVVYERENGLQQIRVRPFGSEEEYYVQFDEPAYSINKQSNPEYDTHKLRFMYFSLTTPKTIYDYDMVARTKEMLKQYEVVGGYNPDDYQAERIFATAKDGTKIPISLVYKKGMARDGNNPFYLYCYGAYGISLDPWFSTNRLTLLNRGFIFGIAHARGGGEMGRYWYDEGKLMNKMNTFTDVIACAEYIISENYTNPHKLVLSGGSAGGMTVGAVMNMRPDLFDIVIADVPFVDVINTMLDETIPLTVIEYEEWGNPHKKDYYDYMMQYSPYDNVKAQNYPNILITAGLNDPRVQYWEPAKWTAKLRHFKTDSNRLLLKTDMGQGHLGASGRFDYLKDIAFEYAFIFDLLGIKF